MSPILTALFGTSLPAATVQDGCNPPKQREGSWYSGGVPNNCFVWLVAGYGHYNVFPYLCYLQKASSRGFLVIDLNSVLWSNPERG